MPSLLQLTAYGLLILTSLLGSLACQPPAQEPTQISRITLKVATPFLNTDASLPLFWETADQSGRLVTPVQQQTQIYADGVLLADPHQYHDPQPGTHVLEARWGPVTSPPMSVTVRAQQPYQLVRLPVVYHLARHLATALTAQQLQTLLTAVNARYRNQWANPDPNRADSFIEFYAAAHDPLGQPLAQAGIHPLAFDDPLTDEGTTAKVDSLLAHWCVKQYINVFVGIDWAKRLYAGQYDYSYTPPYPGVAPTDQLTCRDPAPVRAAISILPVSLLKADILAHELGHALGLRHTFAECGAAPADEHVLDTPRQMQTHPDGEGRKVACNRVYFTATNVMDYYNDRLGFTQDQVAVMRSIIGYPVYLPLAGGLPPSSQGAGRQGRRVGPVLIVVE